MPKNEFTMKSEVWVYPGESANWHFASVPKEISAEIMERFGTPRRGWGSIPVFVTIRKTTWKTSIFPDKKSGMYLLPLKSEIRTKESVRSGDVISLSLRVDIPK